MAMGSAEGSNAEETEEELALRLEFNERYIAAKEQGQFDIPQEVWDRASDAYTSLPVEFREAFGRMRRIEMAGLRAVSYEQGTTVDQTHQWPST